MSAAATGGARPSGPAPRFARAPDPPDSSFAEAVREAQLLLRFTARNGIPVAESDVAAIVDAAAALERGEVTEAAQKPFWVAFRDVAVASAPVTVDSIHATLDTSPALRSTLWMRLRNQPVSLARWSSFKFRWIGIATLLAVITLQIFWVVGLSVVDDTLALERQIKELNREIERGRAVPPAGTPSGLGVEALEARQMEREEWLIGNYVTLRDWNRTWAGLLPLVKPPFETTEAEGMSSPAAQKRMEVISAAFVLQALSTYVLPLLYGLLGACAYVLRDLAREIRAVTFSAGSNIRYGLRLALGPLAGIAVGLLIAPEAQSDPSLALPLTSPEPASSGVAPPPGEAVQALSLRALGPLALAFIAGYSVELVFTAMDRIIGAFAGDGHRAASGARRDRGGDVDPGA